MLHAVLLLNALLARLSFGDDIDPNDWTDTTWPESPFMALLHILSDGSLYQCGGSIVATDEWEGKGVILTAAHCVYDADAVMVQVGCTQTDCSDQLATAYNDDFMVVHPDYNPDLASNDIHWQDNDIALIFLRESIDVAGAQRVQLHNDMSFLVNDDNVTVYGYLGTCEGSYGCTGGSDTDTLEFARTNFMAADECDNVWGRYVTGPHDFCVKDDTWRNGLQGVCRGDSGSPALVDGKQIGLNSWGPASCDARHPSVLTAVPYYFAWISEQLNGAEAPVSPDPEEAVSEAACSLHASGFSSFAWLGGGWDMNGEYTFVGEHDGKPMYQFEEFVVAYSRVCSQYILSDTTFLPYSASFCRCDRSADDVDQCATYGWECSGWVGPGTISGCTAHTASAHSAARSRMWNPDASTVTSWESSGISFARSRSAPAQDDWHDVAADVTCGADESFPFALDSNLRAEEDRFLRFRLAIASDVTLSNCHTNFNTILRLWSQDRSVELSQTLGGCDGDDCECTGCHWHNEQFSISDLPAGTYYVQIGSHGSLHGAYSGYTTGEYKLNIECSPPAVVCEPMAIDPQWISPELAQSRSEALSAWIAPGAVDVLAVALLVSVLMLAMLVMWPRTPRYAKVQTLDDAEQVTQSEAEEILHVAD